MTDFVSKNTSSAIWQYFWFKWDKNGAPGDLNEAACRLCFKPFTGQQHKFSPHLHHQPAKLIWLDSLSEQVMLVSSIAIFGQDKLLI